MIKFDELQKQIGNSVYSACTNQLKQLFCLRSTSMHVRLAVCVVMSSTNRWYFLVLLADMALLSSIVALSSLATPDSLRHNMAAPFRSMTSLFPGGGGGQSSWWRLGDLDLSSTAASNAGRR